MIPNRTGARRRRNWVTIAAIAGAFALAPSSATQSQTNRLPSDLVRALSAYNQATINKDITALAGLVTDDYMLVNSDSSVQGKASYLADFEVPDFKLEPYVVEQPVYRVRDDAALTGGTFRLNWTQKGHQHSRRLRIAHFWVKQNDRWLIDYTQLTRVPD
jgi:ketosteroid isomerase-like protein